MRRNRMWRRTLDLQAIAVVAWALVGLAYLAPYSHARAALGLAAFLFCPGYALLAALYPQQELIRTGERIALSIGFSIILLALGGLALYLSPWGLQQLNSILATALTVSLLCVVAAMRRDTGALVATVTSSADLRSFPHPRVLWIAVFLTAAGLATASGLMTYRLQKVLPGAPFTEFYLLEHASETERYPVILTAGEPATYTLVIANQEHQPVQYRVRVLLQGKVKKDLDPVTLADRQRTEMKVVLTAPDPVERASLEFHLLRGASGTPYRVTQLWVKVQPAPG